MARAIRAGGPFVRAEGWWLLRRLAPDCSRIELADLPTKRDEVRMLRNMGRETANVHLGSPGAKGRILKHLAGQRTGWLREVAGRMSETVSAEAEAWRGHWSRGGR
jgi:hypothetical protein